ncbi:putative toxin-antitoxin system toxin component, PIN family [Nodosilinea sp. LEGE 06152]|uniref:putative toxin-antitoxin system toxin component, PIN family n=1 Tax=Nodosilinea sp. LEGE 06152 TaxID=2777966 RepID=UPI00187F8675|nr:putative toxin-antitoxin system toxin component, PIN family [Nodosilinea sp. LEGE 06152]
MLKVIIDTSVFVAGILSRSFESSSFQLLEIWKKGGFTLVISPQLLRELVVVLLRRGVSETDLEDFIEIISLVALHIPGAYETAMLDDVDPDDNKFLAAAYEAKADFLISLDRDLLNLKFFYGTQIVTPAAFLDFLANGRP